MLGVPERGSFRKLNTDHQNEGLASLPSCGVLSGVTDSWERQAKGACWSAEARKGEAAGEALATPPSEAVTKTLQPLHPVPTPGDTRP